MEKETLFSLLILAPLGGVILGFLLGWGIRRSADATTAAETDHLRRANQELSQEVIKAQQELSRKRDIATKIPMVVKRLSGRLSHDAIPAIGVRFAREFFHASQVGYLAPVGSGDQYTLVEGVGFPLDWKGTVRLAADEGILAMSLQTKTITTREDYLTARTKWPAGIHSLEKNGISPDFVAPVTMNGNVMGILVVASSIVQTRDEIPFVSMIAELLGNAYKYTTEIESVEHSASVDPLTKLFTRGHFAQRFEMEIRRAKNYAHPLSIFLLDIDHFKNINDTHGHSAGDLILMKLGQILRQSIRSSDLSARFGGEEFVVMMLSTGKEQALNFSENLRKTIESTEFRIPGVQSPLKVTISGGLATYPADGDSTTDLLRKADEALYKAKQTGRNRVALVPEFGLDGKPLF
ncbi:MAG: sensor domain-containing diguanylate cyclase [Candidatus Deferrimicrobiaceae bacterium]